MINNYSFKTESDTSNCNVLSERICATVALTWLEMGNQHPGEGGWGLHSGFIEHFQEAELVKCQWWARGETGLAWVSGWMEISYMRPKNIRKGIHLGCGEDDDLIVSYSYTFCSLVLRPKPSIPIEFAAALHDLICITKFWQFQETLAGENEVENCFIDTGTSSTLSIWTIDYQLTLSKQPLVGQSIFHQWLFFKIYFETLPCCVLQS